MCCVPQLDSIIHDAELSPTSYLLYPYLPDLSSLDVKLDCSISNLSLNVRCDTSHFCWCNFLLKSVRTSVSDVSSYFSESKGGLGGSGGKSIPVASICQCVDVLPISLIMHT